MTTITGQGRSTVNTLDKYDVRLIIDYLRSADRCIKRLETPINLPIADLARDSIDYVINLILKTSVDGINVEPGGVAGDV